MTSFRKPVKRVTESEIGHSFGCDWDRKLVVTLNAGDLISIRPQGTRREVSILAVDVYRYILRCEANKALLEKARMRKESKALRLSRERERRAEKRLLRPLEERQ